MTQFDEIKASFENHCNEENAKKMAAYMRNRFKFYGIATPQRRLAYKNILLCAKKPKCIDWKLLDICWEEEHREFQYFVLDYLDTMQKYLAFEDILKIEKYVRSKQWWDSIDGLDTIIGKIGLRDSKVNSLMLEWSHDADFWVRRTAIDHQLCRKDKTDTELLEKILVNNFGSDEFFINKAIGWSLRDYSKTNPEWVRAFIDRYKSRMSPLSIREASKYV